MTHGSLFSGIGGFDLAAEWMGWENKFHCEWNEFGQRVLKHYWPKAESYDDITKTDFTIHRGRIDIIIGGFPCQPYSQAGKRLGKEDDRHLWPEMLRAIREIQPRWVVGENVRGLISWNEGLVFDEVQADLEAEGYEVLPFLLPACALNAPHRRDRVWFVAHSNHSRANERVRDNGNGAKENEGRKRFSQSEFREDGFDGVAKNTHGNGRNGKERKEERSKRGFGNSSTRDNERIPSDNAEVRPTPDTNGNFRCERGVYKEGFKTPERHSNSCDARSFKRNTWQDFPTQSPICNGDDGLSSRLDGITFPKWRNESIKAGGNAIVPQVVLQIFKAIQEFNKQEKS